VFVLAKPFQPSIMFVGEAGAYPRVEHLKGSTRIFLSNVEQVKIKAIS
jgi:hypothetical protein